MQFFQLIKKKIISTAILSLACISVIAQTAGQPVKEVTSSNNQLAVLLSITAVILALVIWGMGKVLIEVGRLALDKNKKSSNTASVIILLLAGGMLSQQANAQTAATEVIKELPNYGGLSETLFYTFVGVIGIEIAAIFFLAFMIRKMYTELMPSEKTAVKKENKLAAWWNEMDAKIFTKAVPVSKEADVMLDHDYDGIRELDNALPPWWKYGFYITIVVAFIYILHFHVMGNGLNPTQEYQAEMEKAQIDKELFDAQNKDKIDEKNVPMADAAGLEIAKGNYMSNCASCHGQKGEGGAGPNFTDDYWIHKGGINDVYQSIKNGYPDKGMQSWSLKFNPKEMSQLTSYIKSLKGTNPPGGKAPQGDFYSDEVKTAVDTAKSTTAKPALPDTAKK